MFATDKHLFIGMHRTGTSWVCRVLEATFGPSLLQPVHHTPLSLVPEHYQHGKTIVGIRCNPLEWYVSRWAYAVRTAKDQTLQQLGFTEYLDRFMTDPHGPIGKACESFPLAGPQLGAYSYLYVCYFFRRARDLLPGLTPSALALEHDTEIGCDQMMRRTRLSENLRDVFGPDVEPHLCQWRNATHHKPWQAYYETPEGRKWRQRIIELDAAMFSVWGYEQ